MESVHPPCCVFVPELGAGGGVCVCGGGGGLFWDVEENDFSWLDTEVPFID